MLPVYAAAVASLAGFATASPTPQSDDPKPPFGVSFTYVNGTFTEIFPVPDSLGAHRLGMHPCLRCNAVRAPGSTTNTTTDSDGLVINVFFQTPATGVFGRCTLLEPDRQGLGTLEFNKPTIRTIDPPAVIGWVQCNTE